MNRYKATRILHRGNVKLRKYNSYTLLLFYFLMKIKTPIKRTYNHEFFPRIGNYINIKFSQKLQ